MPSPTYPFRIQEGVFLEDANVLLPWSATLENLAGLADATRHPEGNLHAIEWGVRRCFGGISIAPIRLHQSPPDGASVFKLRMTDFEAAPARAVWQPALDALTASFGPPHQCGQREGGSPPFPFAAWYFGNIRLSHVIAERIVEYTSTLLYRSDGPPPRLS